MQNSIIRSGFFNECPIVHPPMFGCCQTTKSPEILNFQGQSTVFSHILQVNIIITHVHIPFGGAVAKTCSVSRNI